MTTQFQTSVADSQRNLESGEPFVILSDRDPSPVEGYLIDVLDVDGAEEVFETFKVRKRTPDTWVLETVHP